MSSCFSVNGIDIPLKAQSAQVFESIAFVLYFLVVIFAVLKVSVFTERRILLVLAAINSFVAAFFGIVGVILLGTTGNVIFKTKLGPLKHTLKSDNFHFSFAFCIIATLCGIATGVWFVMIRNKTPPSMSDDKLRYKATQSDGEGTETV